MIYIINNISFLWVVNHPKTRSCFSQKHKMACFDAITPSLRSFKDGLHPLNPPGYQGEHK